MLTWHAWHHPKKTLQLEWGAVGVGEAEWLPSLAPLQAVQYLMHCEDNITVTIMLKALIVLKSSRCNTTSRQLLMPSSCCR